MLESFWLVLFSWLEQSCLSGVETVLHESPRLCLSLWTETQGAESGLFRLHYETYAWVELDSKARHISA